MHAWMLFEDAFGCKTFAMHMKLSILAARMHFVYLSNEKMPFKWSHFACEWDAATNPWLEAI